MLDFFMDLSIFNPFGKPLSQKKIINHLGLHHFFLSERKVEVVIELISFSCKGQCRAPVRQGLLFSHLYLWELLYYHKGCNSSIFIDRKFKFYFNRILFVVGVDLAYKCSCNHTRHNYFY